MFVTVLHRITDPEGFQKAEAKALEAGHPSDLRSSVLRSIDDGPVQPSIRQAHAILGVAIARDEAARELLDRAVATGFEFLPSDPCPACWTTSSASAHRASPDTGDAVPCPAEGRRATSTLPPWW